MTAAPLSAVLIGNESLLIRCGDRLLDAGVRIVLVVTEVPAIARWVGARGLASEPYARDIPKRLGPGAVDYVLSIGNLRVLSDPWLAMARRLAVNFHDGPLPRYRGLHATSWALINRERQHGITWHIATPEVDRGAILEQELFDVDADDSALTLNAKCYEAGALAFERLLASMLANTVAPRPATLADGPEFGRRQRPAGAGHVDWRRPIDECDALVRALDFGPYDNPLGLPWAMRDGRVVRVNRQVVAHVRENGAAGFDTVPADVLDRLSALHARWCDAERRWAARLARLDALDVGVDRDDVGPRRTSRLAVPEGVGDGFAVAAGVLLWLARSFDRTTFDVAFAGPELQAECAEMTAWVEPCPPLRIEVDVERPVAEAVAGLADALRAHDRAGSFLRDLVERYSDVRGLATTSLARRLGLALVVSDAPVAFDAGYALCIRVTCDGRAVEWQADPRRLWAPVDTVLRRCAAALGHLARTPHAPVRALATMDADDRRWLQQWASVPPPAGPLLDIVSQFQQQASRTPHAVAVATWRDRLTYAELDRRSGVVARSLRARGIGRGAVVGLHLERTSDLLPALLGVLKAGAAYLPLDPAYPAERLRFMASDSGAALVLAEADGWTSVGGASVPGVAVAELLAASGDAEGGAITPPALDDLIYMIYTSGSTGQPKGVLLDHRNVASFFAAMDECIDRPAGATWLAVTSLSFDISVLELLWTVCRGVTVRLHADPTSHGGAAAAAGPIDLSLFYFASDESAGGADRYRVLMDGARFADDHGFEAVWTPERHFHAFGGLYPNPAVTSAAVAAVTRRIGIRAGSLVMPLHHPVRVAEDWSLVDNLSNGRVGVAFASGWHPNDFVFAPHHHAVAKRVTFEGLDTVRRLWRGEPVTLKGPQDRDVVVRTLPRPVQPELPFWITTAGNPDTFRQAGAVGGNVLTHLLGQTVDEVAAKIAAYREARRAAGHTGEGRVTLMLHTFVGGSDDEVRDVVRGPMKQYLGSSLNLVKAHAWSFPAFKGRQVAADADTDALFAGLSPDDVDALLEHAFLRYFETGGLFGSVATCVATIERLRGIGVDEIACLIDFGVPGEQVLAALPALAEVRRLVTSTAPADEREPSVAESLTRFGVTHLQCTPSMAALLVADQAGAHAVGGLQHLLVGGEALPAPLAARLRSTGVARLTNMYGPTETTIWSLTHEVQADESPVPIGRPIAGTSAWVLDSLGELVPPGGEGELYLGGPGVARGYHHRPELTEQRFVADRFAEEPAGRLYRTGDRVRHRPDGVLEFIGRMDQQVKLRGHRVELGEIEAELRRVPGVADAAVVLREDMPGDRRLVAYVIKSARAPIGDAWRGHLQARLPEVMVPSALVELEALPLTPNGKLDRRALPAPASIRRAPPSASAAPPQDDMQRRVAAIWAEVLGTASVGVDDNFFDLGGHSLLTLQVAQRLGSSLGRAVPITDLFRFPTIRGLASHLAKDPADTGSAGAHVGDARAAARRAARSRVR